MISISEAISIVKHSSKPLLKETIKRVEKAGGYILFKDVISPINMPPFRQSAMDGYALNLHDNLTYTLIGEVKAGDGHQPTLKKGEAVRIFTGAAVPDSANAVMMQEKVSNTGNSITLEIQANTQQNIRPLGEQVKTGDIALKKGSKLTPAAIGYLISLGITEVSVFKKPNIALVTTGNELIEAGQELTFGKIYESNSKMLLSALYSLKFYDVTLYKVEDNYTKTVETLQTAINDNDLVLITGGISVGDYDFVGKALNELKVQELFYKVKQKPGKPLFYGKKNDTQIFALPGNPAAALSCFYVYVFIALQKLMNRDPEELPRVTAKSVSSFKKKGDRPQFLKAIYNNGTVEILEGQNSSMLQTFALSNALVYAPETFTDIIEGDTIEVILLPV
ncbi:molybdopterin molybdotransferase MoeA [Algibacter amylolyticus]|uniref:Molybdopterin molybdenumtransferase n=1 Tax=Algibacter amylolyticus TaxID=1608400 RepID=A0A5M7AY06_9FLAO|nr:molybdopterin molybdotransferase MoeA [Algibacter amylolyticus]KAA5822313.1 molybdopterin molybdotransferase MoeA [Algibacter amylolyticus]MBB5269027.1 molybdopterin molybdotransferase [Algibacter amylolyticus]TSJ73463.1 molybdopterin molybdotransferase MoeA [Algibacter amylolyticus]